MSTPKYRVIPQRFNVSPMVFGYERAGEPVDVGSLATAMKLALEFAKKYGAHADVIRLADGEHVQ